MGCWRGEGLFQNPPGSCFLSRTVLLHWGSWGIEERALPSVTPLSAEMTDQEANSCSWKLPFLLHVQCFFTGNFYETQFHPLHNGHKKL